MPSSVSFPHPQAACLGMNEHNMGLDQPYIGDWYTLFLPFLTLHLMEFNADVPRNCADAEWTVKAVASQSLVPWGRTLRQFGCDLAPVTRACQLRQLRSLVSSLLHYALLFEACFSLVPAVMCSLDAPVAHAVATSTDCML